MIVNSSFIQQAILSLIFVLLFSIFSNSHLSLLKYSKQLFYLRYNVFEQIRENIIGV